MVRSRAGLVKNLAAAGGMAGGGQRYIKVGCACVCVSLSLCVSVCVSVGPYAYSIHLKLHLSIYSFIY